MAGNCWASPDVAGACVDALTDTGRGARCLQSREPAPQMTAAGCLFADAAGGYLHAAACSASAEVAGGAAAAVTVAGR